MASSDGGATPPPARTGSNLSHASASSKASLSSLTRLVTSQLTKVLQRPAGCCGDGEEDQSPHRRGALGQAGKVVPTNRRKHMVTPAFSDETVPLDDEVRLPLTTYMQMLQLADECHARGGHRFIRGTEPHMVQSYLVDLDGLSDPDDLSEGEWELGKEPTAVNRCRSKPTRSFRQAYFIMDELEEIKLREEAEKTQRSATEALVSAVAPVPVPTKRGGDHIRVPRRDRAPTDRSRDRDTTPSSAAVTDTTNPLSPTSTEARREGYTLSVPRVAARKSLTGAGEATPRKGPSPSRLNTANKRWKAALTITRITNRWPRPEKKEEPKTSPAPQEPKRGLRRSASNLSKLSAVSRLSQRSQISRRSSVSKVTAVSLPSRNSRGTISSLPSNTSEQLPRHRDLHRSRLKGRGLKHNFQQDGDEACPSEGTPISPHPGHILLITEEDGGEWGERTPSRGERTPGGSPDPDEFKGRGNYSRQGSFIPTLGGEQPQADPADQPNGPQNLDEGFGRTAADSAAQTQPPAGP